MSERGKHLFQFKAREIADAATAEAEYHEAREEYWRGEYKRSVAQIKETATLEVKEMPISGGMRADVIVNYGDPAAYNRMCEASQKIQSHRVSAEKFRLDAKVYATQQIRIYELSTDDVHHYRLGGGPRDE